MSKKHKNNKKAHKKESSKKEIALPLSKDQSKKKDKSVGKHKKEEKRRTDLKSDAPLKKKGKDKNQKSIVQRQKPDSKSSVTLRTAAGGAKPLTKGAAPKQKPPAKKSLDHISRIDSGATHAWFVRLRRNGKSFAKTFSDLKCGGQEKALKEAVAFRDDMQGKLDSLAGAPIPRFRFLKENKRNKTGVTGVLRLSRATSPDSKREDYVAQWHEERYKLKRKYFSIAKYGEEEAFRLAKEYREKMMKKLMKRAKKEVKKLKKSGREREE